ncbi:MAG: zf-HC2 domain-containing protein [Chlorobi bacterium]|nr:zf-HC2 domain-containing protein [Chlorobiota bacterium]
MNCNKTRVLMSCALDCELSAREEEEFLKHLAECPECAAEFTEAKKTKMIIREKIVRVKAPQSLVESILRLGTHTNPQAEGSLLFDQL